MKKKDNYYRYHLYDTMISIMRKGIGNNIHKKFFQMDKNNITVHRLRLLRYIPIILLLPFALQAQYKYEQPKLKEYLPSLAFCFLSGMADGTRDASIFYHIKNGGYFDGRDSWKNKYKNGDYRQGAAYFGSTNVLAWTTDGVHLMSTVSHQADAWAMVMQPPDNNKRFGHLLLKVAAITVARSAGHFLMYDVLIKNQNR